MEGRENFEGLLRRYLRLSIGLRAEIDIRCGQGVSMRRKSQRWHCHVEHRESWLCVVLLNRLQGVSLDLGIALLNICYLVEAVHVMRPCLLVGLPYSSVGRVDIYWWISPLQDVIRRLMVSWILMGHLLASQKPVCWHLCLGQQLPVHSWLRWSVPGG